MKRVPKRQSDEIDKGGMKKVRVEEEMVRLDYLVLEQCVSLMKQKKFTNDLSLESVSKLFAGVLHCNHRKLKVSVKLVSHLNLSHRRWEGDLNLTMKNVTESQLKSIFKEIFIRFKHFLCVSFERDSEFCEQMDGPDILSQVIMSDKEYRPIEVKELKLVYIDQNISSLINNLSTIVKEMGIHGRVRSFSLCTKRTEEEDCEDFCTAISTCTNLRSLMFTGEFLVHIITPLRKCVKQLKNLKHFHFSCDNQTRSDGKLDSKGMVAALQDNTNLRSLSLYDYYGYNCDLANLCAPSMRSVMSRLRHLEISGECLDDDEIESGDWTGFSDEVKQQMQQILSSIHANGSMKVVCVTDDNNYRDHCELYDFGEIKIVEYTSMLTNIFGTYLENSNQAARQIDLFIECKAKYLFKVFSIATVYAIDEMLKKEEYDGMIIVDQSNELTIFCFENAKLVIQMKGASV